MNPTVLDEAHRLISSVEPTCEYRSAHGEMTCSTEAAWLLKVSCGDSAFFCDGHREATASALSARREALYCAGHGGKRVWYDWIAL